VRGVGDGRRALAVARHRAGHEINNPLTVVGGNLQLLAEKVGDRPKLTRYFDLRRSSEPAPPVGQGDAKRDRR
jgi:signal transduction histidine kinase